MSSRSMTWSTNHKHGSDSLAQSFPNFQINAKDAANVKVEARSPSGRMSDLTVDESSGVFNCNFTPTEVGDWLISIMYDGKHIQGSPFNVRVYDAARVRVFGLEGGTVGKNFNFQVDTAGAGEGTLAVDITRNGRSIPCNVTSEGRGMYRINFTPDGSGIYSIKVLFAGMEVPGSPYTFEIKDTTQIKASGDGLSSVEVNRRAAFNLNTGPGGSASDIRVTVTSPRGQQVPSSLINNGNGNFSVEYTPVEVGEYLVDVHYYNKPISGSPFRVQAFDWNLISVHNIKSTGTVGRIIEFDIDASQAGSGNLEIMVNDGTIPCSVQNRGNRQFHATFVPKEAISHNIQMRFNGKQVKGSPWRVDVRGAAQVTAQGQGLQTVTVGRPAAFDVRVSGGAPEGELTVTITPPSRRSAPAHVTSNFNGNYKVEYTAKEVGSHQIDVLYEGAPIAGSPFTSRAFDVSAINVSAIQNGITGRPVEFTIDVTQAGEGQLEIMVNRGQVPNSVKMLRKGVFLVTFVPRDARPHAIDIKFNGELIPQCPINVPIMDSSRVTVQGDGIRQVAVNRQSFFRVNTQAAGDADLSVRVTSPTGEMVPAQIVQQPDADYKVEYSSRFTGRHTVEILYAGQAIMGSPFYVEIYDPNKIRVDGPSEGSLGEPMEFDIIRNEAGKAELGLSITSPTGRSVPFDIAPTQFGDHVSYIPQEPGPHRIFIHYGGLEVPGCPITQTINDASTAEAYGDGLDGGVEGQHLTFFVDSKGQRGEPAVQVDGPNSIAKCNIQPEGSGRFLVTYIPVEVGIYKVTVRWNGKEIAGSPFKPKVIDPSKIRVIGGWESVLNQQGYMNLRLLEAKNIEFDCSAAGPGKLYADVQSSSYGPVMCDLQQLEGGRYFLSFTPPKEDEYTLTLSWNNLSVPRSPLRGSVQAASNFEKVVLTGRGLQDAMVREEAEFVIDGTEAGTGTPHVTLTGVKTDIDVRVQNLGGNKYKCTYMPQLPGAYLLNIHWSDRQVRGSPFKVNVIVQSDASKVLCTGEGLKIGTMGKEIKCLIDTRMAGPGELTAHCVGPTKVAFCELHDHRDGTFILSINPQEHGRHILQIKYGGEHVPGSPFTLKISGAPDASKVRVSGPGVEHGILATYQSRFICETRGAGAGQLTVRIRGPKGAFRVEMQRESQKDRTILCRYDPTEVGDYILSVKWSGDHVPGSPFHVQIFDTQEELERFMAENPHRRQNAPVFSERSSTWSEEL